MTYNSESQVYYYKFLELQEKLRRSEEDRLKLEIKLNEMIQRNREEEQEYYQTLKSQYKDFIKSDAHRILRNEQILKALEKIEMKISLLSSKTERFKVLRQYYQAYLDRTNSTVPPKPNLPNISDSSEQQRVTENLKPFSMPRPEERKKDDAYNHNYVYNYLKKNIQSANIQQNPTDSRFQLNLPNVSESIPPLYSFSNTKVENSKNVSNSNEQILRKQHDDVKQNALFQNDHNKYKYSPLIAHDQPQGYITSGLYNNLPNTQLEIQGKQSSKLSFPSDTGNTFDKKLFPFEDHLNISTPNIHARNLDFLHKSLYPNTHEVQSKPIEIETNNHDVNYNALLNQISSSQQPEPYEYNNRIISDDKPLFTHGMKDKFGPDTVAKEIVDSKYMREKEEIYLQVPELSTEPSSSKVQLDHNEMAQDVETINQSKSIENQICEREDDFSSQNFPDQMKVSVQKISEYQIEVNVEQNNIDNNEISCEVPTVTNTEDVENRFNQEISTEQDVKHDGNLSKEEYVSKSLLPLNDNADFKSNVEPLTTDVEVSNQNGSDTFSKNEIENVPNHTYDTSRIKKSDASEVPRNFEEPEVDVTVQNSEYQFEKQKYHEETHEISEADRNYGPTDQLQAHDEISEQISGNHYPQYVNNEQILDNGQTELTHYDTESVQKLPTGIEEQLQDETLFNIQSNIQYEEEQVNNFEGSGNIVDSNQNFDPNNEFQTYTDNSEQYLPSDQYPQYVQNEEALNYNQDNAQNFSENEQPYNMQYDEKNLSYMPYDDNNQEYNQQYYEHDANYANYENEGQEYDQNQYDQYNQDCYPPEQHTDYEGHEHEGLDTNLEAPGAIYPEAEYNKDGLCQGFVKEELEPVAQSENNVCEDVINLVNILETDSENTTEKSDVKVSNESDFDFSSNQ